MIKNTLGDQKQHLLQIDKMLSIFYAVRSFENDRGESCVYL